MKRAVSFLALLLVLPTLAHAKGQIPVMKALPFKNLGCATCIGSAPVDSFYTLRGSGVVSSAENADTTEAFAPLEWSYPGQVFPGVTVASDTVGWMRVVVTPEGTSPTVTADTLGVIAQVSDDDGSTWTSVVWTGPRIDPDVAAMGQAAITETGTSNGFAFVLRESVGGVTKTLFHALNTAPTDKDMYGYGLIRFIFTGDHTGRYRCRLVGFKNSYGQGDE